MMAKRRTPELIRGHATHRRTEGDYMGALLDTVSLNDWQDVVKGALQAAKDGDAQARNWLAQYLIGRPEGKAPTPLTVVVQQLNGADPVVDRLAKPLIDRKSYPMLHENDDWKDSVRALVAAELVEKIKPVETVETVQNPASARAGEDSDG
jgi:hypothetical protein